jgi:hypothetical protein
MISVRSGKSVDQSFAAGRLEIARSFFKAAEDGLTLAEQGQAQNPIVSSIVLAAIAYCDALTAKYSGQINQKDHRGVVKLLRGALGSRLPRSHENYLIKVISAKDDVQYGYRQTNMLEANQLIEGLRPFAAWAEQEFNR